MSGTAEAAPSARRPADRVAGRPLRAAAAGLVVGALATAAVGGTTDRTTPGLSSAPATTSTTRSPLPPVDPQTSAALVAAFERSLGTTVVVDRTFERRLADGTVARSTTRLVQRPPDRLVIGAGGVSGRLGGERINCGVDGSGTLVCRRTAVDEEDPARREVQELAALVTDDAPDSLAVYAVEAAGADPTCFRLTLRFGLPAAPYGQRALLCFDAASGALVRSRIERAGSTDETEAVGIRREVSDDDLVIPATADDLAALEPVAAWRSGGGP